ncbi:transmembrane protein, putative, partial [Bodo saltans]
MDLINVLPTATTPMSTRRSTPVPSSSQTFLVPPPSQVGFTLWTIIDVLALFEEVAQSGHEDKIAGIKSNANELGATCCWWQSKWAPLLQMFALRPFLYTPTTSSSLKEIMDEPSASSTTDPNHAGGEEGRDDSSNFIHSPQQALCLRLLAAAVAYSNGKTSTTLSSSHMKEANAKSSDTASVDAEFQAECWWPKFDDKKNKYFFVSLLNPTAKRWSLRRTGDGATALNSNNTSAAMSPAASISHHPQQQQTTQPSQVNYPYHNHQRITWGDSVHSRTVETSRSSSSGVISKPIGGGHSSNEGNYYDDGAVASSSSPRAFLLTSPAKSNSSSALAFPPTQHLFTHVTTTASSLAASVTDFTPSHPPMMTLVQA